MSLDVEQDPFKYGDTVNFGPWPKGVNNVDRSLTLGPDELVDAVNFDINRAGILTRRSGHVLSLAGTNTHSLWARDATTAFYVDNTDLKMLAATAAGGITASTIRSGSFAPGTPVAYVAVNGVTYYSNGIITGVVRADNTSHSWGVERPSRGPVLTRGAGGLPAGWYQVGLQYVNDLGEISGMQPATAIQVVAASSIAVSSIPAPASADVTYVRVFVSTQNGDVLFRYGDYAAGVTSVTINPSTTLGRVGDEFLFDVMPPATALEYYNGRIYGLIGALMSYSESLAYGRHQRNAGFLPLARAGTVIKAVDDGVFVGTDTEVVFLAGGQPNDFRRHIALPFGAVPGTGVTFPKTEASPLAVGWMSERGFVKGYAGGKVEVVKDERVATGMYSQGAAMYRELNGVRQVVSSMRGVTREAMVSSDYASAEVRRNGVLI